MKNLNQISKKNEKGITLIALVITIIVLLILAGVSIAMLTGDNGIFTRANESKIQTALGAVKEGIKLEETASRIEEKELTPETLLAEGKATRTVQEKEEKYCPGSGGSRCNFPAGSSYDESCSHACCSSSGSCSS